MEPELVARLEARGVPGPEFWEDDLEMPMGPPLQRLELNGGPSGWLAQRNGREASVLCHVLGADGNGTTRRRKAALDDYEEKCLPFVLVESFSKFKSKAAVFDLGKARLPAEVLALCQKDDAGEDFDKLALLFALYAEDPANLRLAFHLDKVHKSGFARMRLVDDARRPDRSLAAVLQEETLGALLEKYDRSKRDGRRSELKGVVQREKGFLVFIRRANRPDRILDDGRLVHGHRPEWIILDFEEGAKRAAISSVSIDIPLEIANRIASAYYDKPCEYANASSTTYAKQIVKLLTGLATVKEGDLVLVELVAGDCALEGSPKIKITDPDSDAIGPALAHFATAVGPLLDDVAHLESVKVLYRKKRVSLIFEPIDPAKTEFVVRYSDHRLNASERGPFERHVKDVHGITVLSTEKRFAK